MAGRVQIGLDVQWIPANGPTLLAQAFFATADRARQLQEPMKDVVQFVAEQIALNFEQEGRPEPWQALAQSTLARRSAHPILEETGALREAATSIETWDIVTAGQITSASQYTLGYGAYHLTGTMFMPVRDWSYIDENEVLDYMDNVVGDYVFEPLNA